MSRLLPGLALFARTCKTPASRIVARSQAVRGISTSPFKPSARPASISTSAASSSSTPTSTPKLPRLSTQPSGLTSTLGLSLRAFSTSQLKSALRPTYFPRPSRPPPRSKWQQFRARMDSLPPTYVVYAIIAINVAVYLLWQYGISSWQRFHDPSIYNWMFKNFILNEVNIRAGRLWTLLTSCFSHMSGTHIFMNCLGLYFIGPAAAALLGTTGFLGLYLSGGIFSALCSLAYQHFTPGRKAAGSEGASGAIYSTLAFYGTIFPRATFLLFFVVPMPAWALVGGLFAYDFYQTLTGFQSRTDSAGHAGGIAAGVIMGILTRRGFRI